MMCPSCRGRAVKFVGELGEMVVCTECGGTGHVEGDVATYRSGEPITHTLGSICEQHAGRRFRRLSWPEGHFWTIPPDGGFRMHVPGTSRDSMATGAQPEDVTAHDWVHLEFVQ